MIHIHVRLMDAVKSEAKALVATAVVAMRGQCALACLAFGYVSRGVFALLRDVASPITPVDTVMHTPIDSIGMAL